MKPRLIVVGAGWAGCAAAVEGVRRGFQVSLIEASRILGGRARRVEIQGLPFDNGQHLLIGAYRDTLRLMRDVGIDERSALLRLPMSMIHPRGDDGLDLRAARLPAPLHLAIGVLRARGLKLEDRLAMLRFSSACKWMGWRLNADCSVAELLGRFDQTPRLKRLLWEPLCLAALNLPAEEASAQVFLNVLKDSLAAGAGASAMLLPRTDLGNLLPEAAGVWLEARGAEVLNGVRATGLRRDGQAWTLSLGNGQTLAAESIVLATTSREARRLLMEVQADGVPELAQRAILTAYLHYPGMHLPEPMLALVDQPENGDWGQFVFDRGQLDSAQAGWMAVVVSAADALAGVPREDLVVALARQLARALNDPRFAQPASWQLIMEKHATFACTPGLVRPSGDLGLPGLRLAGDYVAGPYPATLEGAVRSGLAAARELAQSSSRT